MIGRVDKWYEKKARAKGINAPLGSIRNSGDGRVLVFARRFPGHHNAGYALRSRIVWWLATGEILRGDKFNLHHKNHDRSDDRFSNLEKIEHRQHSYEHNQHRILWEHKCCVRCGRIFPIKPWRLKDPSRGKYCSQDCYHEQPKRTEICKAISRSLRKAYREGRR